MEIAKAFGIVLKKYRTNKGFSQEKLALMCNLDRTYIGLLERAQRQPSLTTIFKICKVLEVRPSEFINEIENIIHQHKK
ncbi:helix-turn-helix transcriptional regulator [Ureibacillus sp. Re31]|uniref:Helix-turn-helix transcriptional regulator n=1 Tax=Ureibacillus galli TaxID=2762222 RepID=A0ABR8X8E2_9BACL|nr:helix-turn-helix transcriptional regulator [Ureibacillus galli]MBD8025583.1 helix-turn-helix transcriptional regulator [Ureibacillus galli]